MAKPTVVPFEFPTEFSHDPLTEVIQAGAKELLRTAVQAEVAGFISEHAHLLDEEGRQRQVRHGFLPERKLKSGIGTESWFCDPQAPWQKGSVENLNKRARRYLPRDTQLAALSNRNMKAICDRLNSTPRKCLGWRTPTEAFREEMMKLR